MKLASVKETLMGWNGLFMGKRWTLYAFLE